MNHSLPQNDPPIEPIRGRAGVSFKALDTLAEYLGLKIVVRGKGKD